MTVAQVASRFQSPRKIGRDKWIALCPVHGDKKPSLEIWGGKSWVLMHCHSHQCRVRDIAEMAGLRMRDLCYTSRDLPSEKLTELYRKQRQEKEEKRLERLHTLQDILRVVRKPEHLRPVRTKTRFECDIERFCDRVSK